MSNGTFGHARRTLEIIDEQGLEADHINVLHGGYLVDLARAIKNGTLPVRTEFQKMLGLLPELKLWKTIKLGLCKSVVEYRTATALKAVGYGIGMYAGQILEKTHISQLVVELDLCVLTVAELGFPKGARFKKICKRIIELGGVLLPAEAGPALRDQYTSQPIGERNVIAMEAIADSGGRLYVFGVDYVNGERWLVAYDSGPSNVFSGLCRVVFGLPRK